MDIIVVCRNRKCARQLFDLFIRACYPTNITYNTSRLEVGVGPLDYMFISEEQEDIILRGRRNVRIYRGEYFEKILDEYMLKKESK